MLGALWEIAGLFFENLPVPASIAGTLALIAFTHYWLVLAPETKPGGAYDRLHARHQRGMAPWAEFSNSAILRASSVIEKLVSVTDEPSATSSHSKKRKIGFHAFWSGGVLDFCLRISVIYPGVAVVGTWLIADTAPPFLETFLPSNASEFDRSLMSIAGIAVFLIGAFSHLTRTKTYLFFQLIAIAIVFAMIRVGYFEFIIVAGTLWIAGLSVSGNQFKTYGASIYTVAICGTLIIAISSGFSSIQSSIISIFLILGMMIAIFISATIEDFFERNENLFLLFLSFFVASFIFANPFLIYFIYSNTTNKMFLPVFIMLVAIPIINTPFDFVSLGMTRGLLQRALGKPASVLTIIWLADVMFSALSLAALTAAITAFVAFINDRISAHGVGLVDIRGTLATLSESPADPSVWWIYGVVLTTFVPTFIHAAVACTGLIGVAMPAPIYRTMEDWLNEGFAGEPTRRIIAAAYFTARAFAGWILSIAAALGILVALWLVFPWYGRVLLWIAATTADFVGAMDASSTAIDMIPKSVENTVAP